MAGMRRPVLSLVLLACLTFFLGLNRQAITDGDEAYYAEAAREMVEGGDWLTPHFNYEYRWEKPILYYWLTAALYQVTGPTEGAARFWSALAGVGLVLLTFGIARDSGAAHEAAWLAAAITATCFGYFAEARLALPDLPLTFCITVTIWTALRATLRGVGHQPGERMPRPAVAWALTGLGAGAGFLMKGPVAVAVPALVLLPIWWRERRAARFAWQGAALAVLIFLLVGTPWYVAMTWTHGRAYLDSFFVGDNLQRFATSRFAGRTSSSWWFYGPILLGGLVPWTAYAVTLFLAQWFRRPHDLRYRWRPTDYEWRLGLWAMMPLAFFTVSLGKQPRYILPVLPPLAILLARSMMRRIESHDRAQPALTIATITTAALFAMTGVLLMRARPLFITASPPVTSLAIVLLFVWGSLLGAIALSRSWTRLPVAMAMAAATLLLALQFGALAGARPEPVERMAQMIRAYRVGNAPVGEYQVFVRNLVFYAGFRQEKDLDAATAPAFLASPERVFLVARDRDVEALRAAGSPVRELGRVQYVDTSTIKLRTLLWPDPARDIETIVLATNK